MSWASFAVGFAVGAIVAAIGFTAWLYFQVYGGGQTSGRSRLDFAVLLALPVLAGAFAAFEMAGLAPAFVSWHTVSYSAQHNPALSDGIAGGAGVVFVAFEVWWWRHMHSSIPK